MEYKGCRFRRRERLRTLSDCSNNRLDWIEKGLEELLLGHGPNISNLEQMSRDAH